MNDSEKSVNNNGSNDQAKLNDYVRIENSPRYRDSSVERKLKVMFMCYFYYFILLWFYTKSPDNNTEYDQFKKALSTHYT